MVAAHHGGIRGDLPEEELVDDVNQSFAKYEVTRARRVFKIARERAIERGVPVFTAPAGYDQIAGDDVRGPKGMLVPNRTQPRYGKRSGCVPRGSFNEVARFLDDRNVKTRAGRPRHSNVWSRAGATRLHRSVRPVVWSLGDAPGTRPHSQDNREGGDGLGVRTDIGQPHWGQAP